jgi:hypothetical protein
LKCQECGFHQQHVYSLISKHGELSGKSSSLTNKYLVNYKELPKMLILSRKTRRFFHHDGQQHDSSAPWLENPPVSFGLMFLFKHH